MAGGGFVELAFEAGQRGGELAEGGLAVLDAQGDEGEGGEEAAGGRVGDELADEGLGVDGLVEELGQLGAIEEEEAVALEEGRGVGAPDGGEVGVVGRQGGGQRGGGGLGFLGDLGVDDDDEQIAELGEEALHRHRFLAPVQLAREQRVGVGGHAQVTARVETARSREQQEGENDERRASRAPRDEGGEERSDRHQFRVVEIA